MKRRSVLPAIGGGFVAMEDLIAQHPQHAQPGGGQPWVGYKPQAFRPAEYAMLSDLVELIVPHEEESPGALDVGVPYFVDVVALYHEPVRRAWQSGLRELRSAGFARMDGAARAALLTGLAAAEESPAKPLEKFFAMAKRTTIDAWALSEEGMRRGLGYKGNHAVTEFTPND